jgi:hypothetical protein
MTIELPQCYFCLHYIGARVCDAFDVIPLDIRVNKVDHHKTYKGDHGIRFAAIETKGG